MKLLLTKIFLAVLVFFAVLPLYSAQDPKLATAGAPYAPLDVSKKMQDPSVPLSNLQCDELSSEFKGLVHLGLHTVSLEKWEGKEMADCDKPQSKEERWTSRCEIITGQGNAYYFFYPDPDRHASTLQELDVRVQGSDERLLDDFRRPVQQMFGPATFVDHAMVPANPSSRIRHWSTVSDAAELFIDRSVRPEGSVRFVWSRHP